MLYQKKSVSLHQIYCCDIMNKNAKSKIDWETLLEVLIFIISTVKELVKRANEQEQDPEKNKEIGSKDEETDS